MCVSSFLCGWYPYRDISFLCDAVVTQKRTTPLPPLTEKNSTGDTQVNALDELFWLSDLLTHHGENIDCPLENGFILCSSSTYLTHLELFL